MYWLFEEMENLNLSHDELCLVLLIQYLNETQTPITFEILSKKLKVDMEVVDQLLNVLHQKGYIEIEVKASGFDIKIDGIFNLETELHFESNIFDLFENEFKRTLTSSELRRISDWLGMYEQEAIVYALRDASMRSIFNFDYINRILENQENEKKQ